MNEIPTKNFTAEQAATGVECFVKDLGIPVL